MFSAGKLRTSVAKELAYVHTDTKGNGSAQTTHSLTSCAIGTATDYRWVVVSFGYHTNDTVTSVVINGVAAAVAKSHVGSATSAAIYFARVKSGTSVAITVVLSGSARALFHVGTISAPGGLRVADTQGTAGSAGSLARTPVAFPTEVVLAAMYAKGANTTMAWTGTGVSEEAESNADSETNLSTATVPDAGATITCTLGASRACALATATFRNV